MIVNFQVTDKVIDESEGGCPTKCVVGNMVMEVLATDYTVGVGSSHVNIYRDNYSKGGALVFHNRVHVTSVPNPPEVSKFISRFDAYKQQDENGMVPVYMYEGVENILTERGKVQGPGRPPLISFQLDLPESCLKPEVVAAIKDSGMKEAVRIVNECASVSELESFAVLTPDLECVTCSI